MDKNFLKETFDLLSLVERDSTLRKSGAYYSGPCPFCGGDDRFTLKSTAGGWIWLCRKCGDGKYQDAIAYVMKCNSLPFSDALRSMGGETVTKLNLGMKKPRKANSVIELPSQDWQEKEWDFVERAIVSLQTGKQGDSGKVFLHRRGFTMADWNRELVGLTDAWDPKAAAKRPAIVLPHFDSSWNLTAVKLRFIEKNSQGLRYISRRGSKPLFWGLHTAFNHHETLMLVEGELNAISIRQCIPCCLSVFSFGSENITAAQKTLLPSMAEKYKRIIVWTDKGEKAREVQDAIGKRCELLGSPNGQDANDLLQAGKLVDFLRAYSEQIMLY